jgi:hypothetical protein
VGNPKPKVAYPKPKPGKAPKAAAGGFLMRSFSCPSCPPPRALFFLGCEGVQGPRLERDAAHHPPVLDGQSTGYDIPWISLNPYKWYMEIDDKPPASHSPSGLYDMMSLAVLLIRSFNLHVGLSSCS